MRSSGRTLGGLKAGVAAVLLFLLAAGDLDAWTRKVCAEVVANATRLMPPSLRTELRKHQKYLIQGAVRPLSREDLENHFLFASGAYGTADKKVLVEFNEAVRLIQEHRPFNEVVFRFGVIAHYVTDIANPLNTSDRDPRMGEYYEDYLDFIDSRLEKFPAVFDGYQMFAGGRENLERALRASSERSNRFYSHIGKAYHPNGGPLVSSDRFDERSLPFGIASLAFSHAVSDAANVWLLAWKEANGDLTNTPYIATAGALFRKYDPAVRQKESER